jgi:hypothetical protein
MSIRDHVRKERPSRQAFDRQCVASFETYTASTNPRSMCRRCKDCFDVWIYLLNVLKVKLDKGFFLVKLEGVKNLRLKKELIKWTEVVNE